MPTTVTATGKAFAEGLTFGAGNEVTAVDSARYPALGAVAKGMVLRSVNGALAAASAKDDQTRLKASTADVVLAFAPTASGANKGDAFDLDSDDDNEPAPFNPATALPPEYDNAVARNSAEVVLEASQRCGGGRCVIIMSEGANPALPIALAAERAKRDVMYIDTVARMKTRQRMEDAGEVFKRSLEKGLWIYVEQATKSITLLRKLAECITEVAAQKKMHPKACVFLMCEPHPHFPESLMKGAVTLRSRLQNDNTAEVDLREDLLESKRRRQVLHGEEPTSTAASGASAAASAAAAAQQPPPEVAKTTKKVRISSEVNIVHLEKSTFLEMSASAHPGTDRENIAGDGVTRVAKYSFGSSEKFISLCKVRDRRFAVGTNSGYVVLLDGEGLPLIQFRPHKACVWDISFSSQFDFATACEDGTSTIFNYSLVGQELMATSVASFQSDVFAVTYVDDKDVSSPVLSGGLSATICVLHSDRQNSSFIASGTSIQAMCATQQKQVIVGGGNGVCSLIDPVRCVVADATSKHSRKVPAVSCHGDVAVTGGFDRMVRVWDVRSGFKMTYETTIAGVVTAVAVNERYSAVCSGSDLLVWDLRKLGTPLASKQNAWKDLTRGLVIEGNLIVTASVDGVTRFWEIH